MSATSTVVTRLFSGVRVTFPGHGNGNGNGNGFRPYVVRDRD